MYICVIQYTALKVKLPNEKVLTLMPENRIFVQNDDYADLTNSNFCQQGSWISPPSPHTQNT